jgi:hypothetical protein
MSKVRSRKSNLKAISILERVGFFAEDKDVAATIREECIRPAVRAGQHVTLDFKGVVGATQSFIHALIAAVIREDGIDALNLMEFKSCGPALKGVISIVVEYCQLDVAFDDGEIRRS